MGTTKSRSVTRGEEIIAWTLEAAREVRDCVFVLRYFVFVIVRSFVFEWYKHRIRELVPFCNSECKQQDSLVNLV